MYTVCIVFGPISFGTRFASNARLQIALHSADLRFVEGLGVYTVK